MIKGCQHTIAWHVDDLKSSHVDPKVNDDFKKWLNERYGLISEVKSMRGKIHNYLRMMLDYTVKGQVSLGMIDYIKKMIEEYPDDLLKGPKVAGLWNDNLFKVNDQCPKLPPEEQEHFHNKTAQGLFLCK